MPADIIGIYPLIGITKGAASFEAAPFVLSLIYE